MTMQMRDTIHFEDEQWALWGAYGEGFFKPTEFGLHIKNTVKSTACYKRYHCVYEIRDGFLQLVDLEINAEEATAPPLQNCKPIKIERDRSRSFDWGLCGNLRYVSIYLPIQFTGGLLLCRQQLREYPAAIGPELAWVFEQVCELVLKDGEVTETYNHSLSMEQIRQSISGNRLKPLEDLEDDTSVQYEAIEAKINACLKFDY